MMAIKQQYYFILSFNYVIAEYVDWILRIFNGVKDNIMTF